MKINNILESLLKDDLKLFQFHLQAYNKSKITPFSRGKLEGKDTMDTATLLTDRYGKEALQVTIDTLKEMKELNLASQLEKHSRKCSFSSKLYYRYLFYFVFFINHSLDCVLQEKKKLKQVLPCCLETAQVPYFPDYESHQSRNASWKHI